MYIILNLLEAISCRAPTASRHKTVVAISGAGPAGLGGGAVTTPEMESSARESDRLRGQRIVDTSPL